jgi:magnesium transporter
MSRNDDHEDDKSHSKYSSHQDGADSSVGSTSSDSSTLETESEPTLFNLFESWSALSTAERRTKFAELPRTEAEELFLSLKTHDQGELISEASALEKRSWVRLLAPDDVADLIQELGADHREEILSLLDHQTRREVTALLAYAEDNAGGLMNSRFVRLRPDMSVDEAISYLRIQAKTQVETIYYAYVIETDQTLMGVVSFRELFSAAPHKKIREIMKTDLVKIPVNMEQEQIAKVFSQHELTAIPVVDEWTHMMGIVTFDDIANVIQEEATEDIQKLGAVEALDAPYMKIGFFELVKKRAGWLMILFVGEMFTATAMSHFQIEIEKAVVLALFIPLIISSGGNSGSQASTLIIRAMALGEVRLKDWWRVFVRELGVGLALGLILGVGGFLRIMIWPGRETLYGAHYALVALTVTGSIIGVVLWGSIAGSMLPFLLRRLNLDPASASAPFVATLCDVSGLIIYFSVASLILSGILL